jgi:long-chain acyl-CoA synthetase
MHTWTLDKPDNLVEIFEDSVKKYGKNELFGTKNKNGEYEWVTYAQVGEMVDATRGGLAQNGIGKGDVVGIIANNRTEWAVCCYAAYGLGARFVPMYEMELESVWRYIITDSTIKVLFISKREIYDKVAKWKGEIATLKHVVVLEDGENSFKEFMEKGSKNKVPSIKPAPGDIAGLIYTSGTTGNPKGVLISHGNFSSNVHALRKAYKMLNERARTLSFLPWAHSYGQIAELNTLVSFGGSTGFVENTTTIVQDLAVVKPTMLVAVPRIFNRVYDGLNNAIKEKGGLAKFLFNMGLAAAAKKRELAKEGKSCPITNAKLKIADKIVFSKFRERFGGRLEIAFSSSAALNANIIQFFFDIGIPIYEAWGMTELSPAGTGNNPENNKIGSVGRALDKVKLVIDKTGMEPDSKDGELIVYGPNVMQGYHNKPEETKATMTEDGGLRTGDRAYIDLDGYLYITGRIKEQFKLENGKFVYPAVMEEEIKLLPGVEQAMIYGLNKAYTVCVVVPDFIVMEKISKEKGFPADKAEFAKNPAVNAYYLAEVTGQLKDKFGSYELPKKVLVLGEGFTVDNGMLTPTLKLKRREVLKKYQAQIDALFA